MSFLRAARRRGEPTLEQAIAHLRVAVAEADKLEVKSPTIEAIRRVLEEHTVTPLT